MELLWSPDQWRNTVHNEDYSAAQWALAEWMASLGRTQGDKLAGSPLPPCRPLPSYISFSSSGPATSEWDTKEIEGLAPRTKMLRAPLFNIVDDSDTKLGELTQAISEAVGCQYGFAGTILSQFAKLNLDSVLEEANEHHLEPFSEMLDRSTPPITSTPLTPQMPIDQLSNNHVALDGTKLETVVGWKPRYPKFEPRLIQEALTLWKCEVETWPNPPPRSKST